MNIFIVTMGLGLSLAEDCDNAKNSMCGGDGWTGSTCCPAGQQCFNMRDDYSYCVPECNMCTLTDGSVGRVEGAEGCSEADKCEYFVLHETDVTSLPDDIFDGIVQHLYRVDMAHNQLTTLPGRLFDGTTNFNTLYLSGNPITELPADLFVGMPMGQWLLVIYADDMKLTSLPAGLFDGITHLNRIYLARNELTTLPDGIFPEDNLLTAIDLRGNNIKYLPPNTFKDVKATQGIHLEDNPLECRVDLFESDPVYTPEGYDDLPLCGDEAPTDPPAPTPPADCANAEYAKCGGKGFAGPTCCPVGTDCFKLNDDYSQCLKECPSGWACQDDIPDDTRTGPTIPCTNVTKGRACAQLDAHCKWLKKKERCISKTVCEAQPKQACKERPDCEYNRVTTTCVDEGTIPCEEYTKAIECKAGQPDGKPLMCFFNKTTKKCRDRECGDIKGKNSCKKYSECMYESGTCKDKSA